MVTVTQPSFVVALFFSFFLLLMGTSTKAGQIDMLVNMQLRKIYIESILSSIKQKKNDLQPVGYLFL